MNDPTVREHILRLCSESLFNGLGLENDYWNKAYKFYLQNRDKKMSQMSPAQRGWIHKIVEGLISEAKKGR